MFTVPQCTPVFLFALVSLVFAPKSFGESLFVNAGAVGEGDGSRWADAFNSLQDALGTASARNTDADPDNDGTEIWVAAGTYIPDGGYKPPDGPHVPGSGDRFAALQLLNGVALYGGFAGGETDLSQRDFVANETILSGDLLANDTLVPCTQNSPDCDSFGALCADGFCIIRADNGENSYHVVTGTGTGTSAIMDGFTITAGNANSTNEFLRRGGGMQNRNFSSPTVRNCTFRGNAAIFGAGMHNNNRADPIVTNCTFIHDWASGSGGGMMNVSVSQPALTNCKFIGNSSSGVGGGVSNVSGGSPTLSNVIFLGNSAGLQGGGMSNRRASEPIVTNCTFRLNSAGDRGGGVVNELSFPAIANSIFWANNDSGDAPETAQIHTITGTPVVDYSIVQGGWSGTGGAGVLDADPLFVDPLGPDGIPGTEDDDLRLMPGSPAIDAGDNDALPDGVTTDLDGNPRFVNDPSTPDTGNPGAIGPPIVDIGAYEFQGLCPNPILDETIVIGDCDTGVENVRFPDGCTMSDLVHACAEDAENHGAFVRCVTQLTNDWAADAFINNRDRGPIQRCTARASFPR